MKPELLDAALTSVDGLAGVDAVCLLVTEDERPLSGAAGLVDWRLCGALSKVLKAGFFCGHNGERLLVPADERIPAPRVFAFGLGRSRSVTALGLEHALQAAAAMLEKAQVASVALALPRLTQLDDASTAAVVKRGFCDHFSGKKVAVFADKALRTRFA